MYGNYSWVQGAAAAQIVGDLVALACGAAVADLSAGCNKAASAVAGAASGWAVVDAAYGVVSRAGQGGGPGMLARLTVSGTPKLQLAAVDGWVMGSHSASFAAQAQDCSNTLAAAGQVFVMAGDFGLCLMASDFATWALVGEVKRDGPALAGDALAPGGFVVCSSNYVYMPRLKSPSAVGDLTSPSVTLASAYGALSAAAVRARGEALYMPMVPAVLYYQQVPIGEVVGVVAAGGYGQGGDYLSNAGGDVFQIVKTNSYLLAVPKR
jgi:hypothetical protein